MEFRQLYAKENFCIVFLNCWQGDVGKIVRVTQSDLYSGHKIIVFACGVCVYECACMCVKNF